MNKAFALLLISAGFLLSGCYKTSEHTETIPAHLELEWEQIFDESKASSLKELSTIPPEMAQQLTKLGQYRSSSAITYTNLQAKVVYRLVFLNETKIDDMHRVVPLLKSIFKEKSFYITFRGKLEKHVKKDGFDFFAFSKTNTVTITNTPITGTTLIPGQAPTSK